MSTLNGVVYAMEPPLGVLRNPDQYVSGEPFRSLSVILLVLASITILIRMYTRAAVVGKVSIDDWLMLLAWICNLLLVAFSLHLLNFGLGKHLWNVPLAPDLYPNFLFYNLLAAIFFCAATGLAKGSILLFYLRIFPSRAVHISVWVAFVATVGYSFAFVFVNVLSCDPIRASWQLELVATAVCINRPVAYFCQAALAIATDIATVLIPVPGLRALRLHRRQKIAVAVLLTIGAFVCIVSIIRLHSLDILLKDPDLTGNTPLALLLCIVELNLSIIGGCVPTIKPFLVKLMPGILGSRGQSSNSNGVYMHPWPAQRQYGDGNAGSRSAAAKPAQARATVSYVDQDTGSKELIIPRDVEARGCMPPSFGGRQNRPPRGDQSD